MNKIDLRLYSLLSDASQVTNEEMQDAYMHFMELVKNISQSKQGYSEIFRTLNFTRIEFDFIESLSLCKLEKK
jgi:hypothetical protein